MEPITTAGLVAGPAEPVSPRREAVRSIRAILRRQDASEDEDIDALEALIELSRGD